MLGMALNARMAHVSANSMVLAEDAPLNRVGALSRVLTVETAPTHVETESIVDAPTTPSTNHVETVSMVLAVDASIAFLGTASVVLVVDFPTAHAVADSTVLIVDASLTCAGADILV